MRDWIPQLDDRDEELPTYLRLARAIAQDLAHAQLEPGARLPGTRSLARALKISRNTINAAFAELETEGWIVSRGSSGTYVSEAITHLLANDGGRLLPRLGGRGTIPARTGYALGQRPRLVGGERLGAFTPALPDAKILQMGDGLLDPRLRPTKLLARTMRSVLVREPALLDYAGGREPSRGHPRLLTALAAHLAERSLCCSGENLLVTRGAQMAIWLAAAALIEPGDRVVIERYGYRPAWNALRAHGAALVPISVDERGLLIDKVEATLAKGPLRAVYLTPHHQMPTGVALCPARRAQLLELARAHRFAIIEDDYDHEFHHQGQPLLPLAASDRDGLVIYIGTLTNVIAPGLRLGWLVAPEALIERCADIREIIDRQGDAIGERAVAEMLETGELGRHMWRTRRALAERRDVLLTELDQQLGSVMELPRATAGLALWAQIDPSVDVDAWSERARTHGVDVRPGRVFQFRRRSRSELRIGFGRCTEDELREGVRRLARAL